MKMDRLYNKTGSVWLISALVLMFTVTLTLEVQPTSRHDRYNISSEDMDTAQAENCAAKKKYLSETEDKEEYTDTGDTKISKFGSDTVENKYMNEAEDNAEKYSDSFWFYGMENGCWKQ
ncbi:MAG: hypothetical protein HKP56_16245 [Anderseniella sp.]|nr:hypothetical protein [Anderseniella sp.]